MIFNTNKCTYTKYKELALQQRNRPLKQRSTSLLKISEGMFIENSTINLK